MERYSNLPVRTIKQSASFPWHKFDEDSLVGCMLKDFDHVINKIISAGGDPWNLTWYDIRNKFKDYIKEAKTRDPGKVSFVVGFENEHARKGYRNFVLDVQYYTQVSANNAYMYLFLEIEIKENSNPPQSLNSQDLSSPSLSFISLRDELSEQSTTFAGLADEHLLFNTRCPMDQVSQRDVDDALDNLLGDDRDA